MPINTLTDLNDLITNGTAAERLAFKNIIVAGLNAQDVANIITSSTRPQKEALADLVRQVDSLKSDTDNTTAQAVHDAALAVAQTWWDTTIQPTLLWSNAQPLAEQRTNVLLDFETVKGLLQTETDSFRLGIVRQKIEAGNNLFKSIKAQIKAGG